MRQQASPYLSYGSPSTPSQNLSGIILNNIYYMVGSASGQDKANPVFWLTVFILNTHYPSGRTWANICSSSCLTNLPTEQVHWALPHTYTTQTYLWIQTDGQNRESRDVLKVTGQSVDLCIEWYALQYKYYLPCCQIPHESQNHQNMLSDIELIKREALRFSVLGCWPFFRSFFGFCAEKRLRLRLRLRLRFSPFLALGFRFSAKIQAVF